MHRSEENELSRCADCGTEVQPETERGFGLAQGALCHSCALKRGGVYDELHDHWVEEPSLAGLRHEFE